MGILPGSEYISVGDSSITGRMKSKTTGKINNWTLIGVLFVLCGIALLIRVEYIRTVDIIEPIRADAREYTIYGLNLLKHQTFSRDIYHPKPDSYRSPGYPFIITAALAIGDLERLLSIMAYLQAAMSTLSVAVICLLGRRFLPDWAALTAAGLAALSPHMIATTSYMLTETAFSFFLLLAIYSFYRGWGVKSGISAGCSGLLFGYTYLINETSLLVPGFLAIGAFGVVWRHFSRSERSKFFRLLVIFIISFAILPCAWMIRNSRLPENAPRGSGRATAALSHGAYPGFVYQDPRFKYFPYQEDPDQPGFGASLKDFSRIFWDRFKQRPVRYVSWYLFEKPYYLWHWNNFQSNKGDATIAGKGDVYLYPVKSSLYLTSDVANWTRLVMKNLHPVLLALALAGVFLCGHNIISKQNIGKRYQTPIFLFIVLVYYTGLYMVFAPYSRYSVPLRPELYLCSMWALNELRKMISSIPKAERNSV